MDTAAIIAQLEEERDRINQAIAHLNGSNRNHAGRKRHMSAEARRKISLAQKRRWAAQKKK
jgi:hypothetical protein